MDCSFRPALASIRFLKYQTTASTFVARRLNPSPRASVPLCYHIHHDVAFVMILNEIVHTVKNRQFISELSKWGLSLRPAFQIKHAFISSSSLAQKTRDFGIEPSQHNSTLCLRPCAMLKSSHLS
jgi:hypothetical protein